MSDLNINADIKNAYTTAKETPASDGVKIPRTIPPTIINGTPKARTARFPERQTSPSRKTEKVTNLFFLPSMQL